MAFTWPIGVPYWYTYWIMALVPVCFPQVFWIKRFRKGAGASLLMVPFLYVGAIAGLIIILFMSHRDFRPAAWTYTSPSLSDYALPLLVFGAVLTVTFVISSRLKNQPLKLSKN